MMRGNVSNDYAVGRPARGTWYYPMFKPIKWSRALLGKLVPVGISAPGLSFAQSRPTTGTRTKRPAFTAARCTPAGPTLYLLRNPQPG